MATYECNNCNMAVDASCAKCDQALVDDILKLDDGTEVQISRCPECEGKIKSPSCCGVEMVCNN
jgi:DNA-directed RNA polymerase subunit RPC12/RpoP